MAEAQWDTPVQASVSDDIEGGFEYHGEPS